MPSVTSYLAHTLPYSLYPLSTVMCYLLSNLDFPYEGDDGGMNHITVFDSLSYGSTRNKLCSYARHACIRYKDSALCVGARCGHLAVSFHRRF